jgi:two-component system LytT family sensor kinase
VNAYLQIEKARFQSNLQIQMLVPDALAHHQLPAFTLQPIVENAIKHGTSQHLGWANHHPRQPGRSLAAAGY